MSRDVSVKDVQEAVMILNAWANSEEMCPRWAVGLIKEMADLVETILVNREEKP